MMKDRARTLFYSYMGVLLFLFVLKLLGYPGLALACENETVIAICNYVEDTFIKYILSFVMYFVTTTLTIQSIFSTKRFIGKQKFIYLYVILAQTLRLLFMKYPMIMNLIDIIIYIIMPLFYNKKLFFKSIIVVVIVFLFQLISFFVKEISIYKIDIENTLIAVVYSLDYIIMLVLLRDYFIDLIFRKESK